MKKLWLFISVICLVFIISGCGSASVDTSNKVVAPRNDLMPLNGKWVIESCINTESQSTIKKMDEWIGKSVEFARDFIVVGDWSWNSISYKIKRVKVEEYFLHKFKGPIQKLGIENDESIVITASSSERFLFEFIKISDSKVIANIDNEFFILKKLSDEVSESIRNKQLSKSGSSISRGDEEKYSLHSGVLLGIRIPANEAGDSNDIKKTYKYKTLWIAYNDGNIQPVYEAEDLFLPRKNGFWRIMVREETTDWGVQEQLFAHSISKVTDDRIKVDVKNSGFWMNRRGDVWKSILYAGNDYVAIEKTGRGKYNHDSKSWEYDRLQVIPVDSISNEEGIKISDVTGENGSMAMERAVNNLIETYGYSYPKEAVADSYEENFGLFRKTGHWFLKGRLNLSQKAPVPFVDFNINLIPPKELIAYDILHVPWTSIKDRIPEAVDAFTSPNKDIAIVHTKEYLLIYEIIGEKLSDMPKKKIKIDKGCSIVMAEWATEYYVDKWEGIFIKNNKVKEIN